MPLIPIVAGLALVGLYISAYFSAVTFGYVAAADRWAPRVCRLDRAGCDSLVHTRQARLFGVPNSVVGLVYYAAILGAAAGGLLSSRSVIDAFLVAAILSVLVAIYLVHALVRVLGVWCIFCLISHAVNLLLAAAFAWAAFT